MATTNSGNTIVVNGIEVEVFNFQNNSYAFISSDTAIDWESAEIASESITYNGVNGHLATVTSEAENQFIVDNVYILANGAWTWLGATDSVTEGDWKWITGEPWNYSNWDEGQPDNAANENYLHYWYGGTWNDNNSNNYGNGIYSYIVEFEGNATTKGFLSFSQSNFSVNEDGTAVTEILVNRTGGSTGEVSATITFTDGTATGCGCGATSVNEDFYNGSFVITLADGETSKTIPVELASLGGTNALRIRNDAKIEGDETFTINLTNPTGGATIGEQSSAVVTIADDDTVNPDATLAISVNKDILSESAGNNAAIGTVTRSLVTNEDLVVTLTNSETTQASIPNQVTILANQATATFEIKATDEGIVDGAQNVNITASATGFNNGSYQITVTDIDLPDLVISSLVATPPLLTGKQASFTYRIENKGLTNAISLFQLLRTLWLIDFIYPLIIS